MFQNFFFLFQCSNFMYIIYNYINTIIIIRGEYFTNKKFNNNTSVRNEYNTTIRAGVPY